MVIESSGITIVGTFGNIKAKLKYGKMDRIRHNGNYPAMKY